MTHLLLLANSRIFKGDITRTEQENYRLDSLKKVISSLPTELHKTLLMPKNDTTDFSKLIFEFENLELMLTERVTNGALSSIGLLLDLLPINDPIVIIPTNSVIQVNYIDFINTMKSGDFEAGTITFESSDPLFSYVRTNHGIVTEVVEKKVISNQATAGVFYFKNLDILTEMLKWAFINFNTTNNTYYLAPALNYLVAKSKKIGTYSINAENYMRI